MSITQPHIATNPHTPTPQAGSQRGGGPGPSPAQLTANRANAQRSTGPSTEQGKHRSSQNATTHGLTATHPPVTHPELAHYSLHLAQVLADLRPTGPVEQSLAQRIALTLFQLDRAAAAEADLLHATATAETRKAQARNAQALHRHQLSVERTTEDNKYRPKRPQPLPDPPRLEPVPAPLDPHIALAEHFTADTDSALARITRYTTTLDLRLHRLLKQFHQQQKLRRDHTPDPDDTPTGCGTSVPLSPAPEEPPIQNEPDAPPQPPSDPQCPTIDHGPLTMDNAPLQNEPAPHPQNENKDPADPSPRGPNGLDLPSP